MATDWKSKFGAGKWVTIRGAHVYVQEGAGLRSAISKLNGKKKKITSPERKVPKLSDAEKNVIAQNEKTIANGRKMWNSARGSGDADQINKAREAIGRGKNAIVTNRLLKGRTGEGRYGDMNRGNTGAADYNNAYTADGPNVWVHESHLKQVKQGIQNAQAARKAAGTNGKLRSPVYAEQTGKLKIGKSKLPGKVKTNEAGKKTLEDRRIKSNEEKIKKYNQTDPNKTDWDEFVKIDDAARIARDENRKLKAKNEPGRGQTVSDYRNPQFKKGDHYSPVGKSHVTARVDPDASKTGEADQELNQLYAQRRPYGNETYKNPLTKGSWEGEVKKVLKNAQAARKANGTEGKLRSDVYKDSPQQVAEKKARANKELKDSIFRQAAATKSFVENRGPTNKNQALIDASKGKTYIADLSKDDGKGTYTIVVPKESRIGGKSDPEGWKVYTGMKLKSKGDFGTTYDSEDGKIGKVTVENNPNGRFEKVYREPSTSPSLRQALQEKVDAQKQPATPTRAKKSAKADTASNEAFIQRWSKPTEGRKWMEANNQITSLRTQVQQMKASGKSTAALEAKIKKLTHENLLRYGKYGPDDE